MKKFKEILIKLNNWKFVILIIVIIGGSFYWFSVRPARIYSKCTKWSLENRPTGTNLDQLEFMYKVCLRRNGINN